MLRAARAEFGLEVDEGARLVFVDGDRRSLSRLEFDALVLLLRRPDLARSYLELLHRLWHPDYGNARNVVHQVMWRLRDELRSAGGVIENVRGFGYRASPVLLRRARRRLST